MKRRFRWCLTAILLYLFSVPTIFVLIGLFTLLVFVNGAFVAQPLPICGCILCYSGTLLHSCLPFLSHRLFWGQSAREG